MKAAAAPRKAAKSPKLVAAQTAAKLHKPAKSQKASVKSHRPASSAIRSANGKAGKASGKNNQTFTIIGNHVKPKERRLDPFTRSQKEKLLQLRDAMVDSMAGVAQDTLRARAEGSEASAFGMHQADAGSDAYDRDFALSLLSQEQDALYEIDEALKRIDLGTYGKCEMSGKPILARAARGDSFCPLHGRMPVAARETEQSVARSPVGHLALWPDG